MTEEQKAEQRADFIRGLRDLATFYERNPSVDFPRYNTLNVFLKDRVDVERHARASGGWEKIYNGDWFSLRKNFGENVTLEINANRETVCRKVITGKRIVEAQPEREVDEFVWECNETPLLAGGANDAG